MALVVRLSAQRARQLAVLGQSLDGWPAGGGARERRDFFGGDVVDK
jgi:hypothetical protein